MRLQTPDGIHQVIPQARTNADGQQLLTCECGRLGWGVRGLVQAHHRPSPFDKGHRPQDVPKVWNPMFSDARERRAFVLYNFWQGSWHIRPGRLSTKVVERLSCAYAGHQESATAPGVCYFCQKRRPKRGWRWAAAPQDDPRLRPTEYTPPAKVKPQAGGELVVWGCKNHSGHNCPYCAKRRSR